MAKNDEMEEVLKRMNHQDKQLEQIVWLLRGNPSLEIEGVIPSVKRIESEVHDILEWRKGIIDNKWKLDLKYMGKWIVAMIGIAGTIFGLFESLKQVFS